ncbi:MAG: hypothetical protein CVU11_15705 [Bacteroidetes bacterium HGW-Bacteroidetes-6]|jgi:hypothetical protein|nr:MAG: hypothetical protein CVU11_15705 [Bacteroidetes bacterium HGW-Bacteroidetes-6]
MGIWFCCLLAAKPGFSQCDTHLNGIDSLSSNASILAFYNDMETNLVIGGNFNKVNSNSNRMLFRWNGASVFFYNQGVTGIGEISSIIKYKGKLYLGGGFDEVDNTSGTANLAIWNGSSWSGCPIGEPLGGDVYDMTVYHDTLFICGMFWCFGSTSNVYQGIIATDGTGWYNVGAIPYVWVSALITYNDRLYLGGYYGMMEYKGDTTWEQISGPTCCVNDMDVDTFNNILYVGGGFTTIGNVDYDGSNYIYSNETASNCVAWFDGFKWHSMGNAINCDVYEQGLKVYHGDVYVGGCFDTTSGGAANYLARWDGTQWNSLSCEVNSVVFALDVFKDTLFIGGAFNAVDGTPADGIMKYFQPDTGCHYLKPLVLAVSDTFKINNFQPTIDVQFYNNNAYADTWAWDFDDGGATANTKDASHIFDTPGTYHVSVTVSHNACVKTATRDITIIDNTGLENYTRESLQFKVFPNPTSGSIAVECTLPNDNTGELRSHNPNGTWKNLYRLQGGFNHVDIPANELNPGLSLLSLFIDGEFVFSEKVVKE